MIHSKKNLILILLIGSLTLLGYSGWQFAASAVEQADSDAQTRMRLDAVQSFNGADAANPELALMDFSELLASNPDISAWLRIDGLGVDYPVVQGSDNQYYLNHTAEKKYNGFGAIFLDHRAPKDVSVFYSVVYGHNIKDGRMFGQFGQMKEQDAFQQTTQGFLYTPDKTYALDIFAVVVANSSSDFYRYAFPDESSREDHLDMIRDNAVYYREIGVTANDRLIALSTCSYEYKDARTILIARMG